jgi:hypothetical protein
VVEAAVTLTVFGGADPRLPGLTTSPHGGPFVLGVASAQDRAHGAHLAWAAGQAEPVDMVDMVDPSAVVASTATVGHGAYLNAGVVVASHTVIGCHVNLNRRCWSPWRTTGVRTAERAEPAGHLT